jgi:HK97 gp10 family phage protein
MTEDIKEQVDKVAASFRAKGKKINSNVSKAITRCCLILERDIKLSMTNTPRQTHTVHYTSAETGREQTYGAGRSVPGNPPAVDTGLLRASITHRIEGGGWEQKTTGYVGVALDYGFYLEFGTSKMAARPWLIPAFERHKEEFKRILNEAIKSGVHMSDTAEVEHA